MDKATIGIVLQVILLTLFAILNITDKNKRLPYKPLCFLLSIGIVASSILYYSLYLLESGNKHYENENYAAAAKNIERSTSIYRLFRPFKDDKSYSKLYLRIGTSYYRIKEYDKAVEYLSKGISVHPDHFYTNSILAHSYFKSQQIEKAKGQFQRLLELDDKEKGLYYFYNIGYAHFILGNDQKALKSLEKAINLEPNNKVVQQLINKIKT